MKIAVCGSGTVFDDKTANNAAIIGTLLAKKGHTIITGACNGYPNEAAKAAFEAKGKVIGYSPAKDRKEHIEGYNFPTDNFSEIIFTARGIPGRNLNLVNAADAVVILDGKIGTLNEFTIAFNLKKKIYVLMKKGGISEMIKEISEICDKRGEKDNIAYEKDSRKLIERI